MNRGMIFFLGFAVFIALMGVVSAGCVNNDQIIMRLGATTNAHGALWNQDYGVKVCYDDYFTEVYVPDSGENVHDCGENLLKLNADVNAHAVGAGYDSYSVNVCHRGLKNCEIKKNSLCPEGKVAIVYLNNLTNSHISRTKTLQDYSQDYYAICCGGQSTIIPPIAPTLCADYTNRAECNSAPLSIAMGDAGCAAADKGNCRCTWNGTSESSGACKVSWAIWIGECEYLCSVEAVDQTECSDGLKVVALNARLSPVSGTSCLATTDPGCRSGSATVPCGGAEAQLPFFGGWQVVVSLTAIALGYLLFGRRS